MPDVNRKLSYQKSFRKYGASPKALQWASKKSAEVRYLQITNNLNFEGKNILDVGCGFSYLVEFIKKRTKNFSYTGVDITPEFIEVSKKKYPEYNFFVNDYFESPIQKDFDIVISSGTLNANINDPLKYRKKAIKLMFDHSKEALAFNIAGGRNIKNKHEGRVYYADPKEIVEYCATLSKKVRLIDNYHPKDFTILMFK